MNYQSELDFLFGRINFEHDSSTRKSSFKTRSILRLMELLGNPHHRLRTVHVAGTKGKGSVASMIAGGLFHSGLNVGVYTSPHLETIRERFVVNQQMISEEDLANSLAKVREAVSIVDQSLDDDPDLRPPTFFEMTTATAFVYFAERQLDWIVMEVGLGGRLDSTNVCRPDLCVITNISLDHTRQLGSTLGEIAFEKAGIIKPKIPVICGAEADEAIQVIHSIAKERSARMVQLGVDFEFSASHSNKFDPSHSPYEISVQGTINGRQFESAQLTLGMRGNHQQTNAAIAVTALEYLKEQEPGISQNGIRLGLKNTRLAGRFELIESAAGTTVLDMAHNVASAQALAHSLPIEIQDWHSSKNRSMVFAVSRDKHVTQILECLLPLFDRVILTKYVKNPRSTSPEHLLEIATQLKSEHSDWTCNLEIAKNPELAWSSIVHHPDFTATKAIVCITGSAFLCAELTPLIRESVQISTADECSTDDDRAEKVNPSPVALVQKTPTKTAR